MNELIERLLPCPFCGSEEIEFRCSSPGNDPNFFVECSDCCAETDLCENTSAAAAAWNRRASPTPGGVVKPTEDAVERAAIALARRAYWDWDLISEGRRGEYLHQARAALEAASSPAPGEAVAKGAVRLETPWPSGMSEETKAALAAIDKAARASAVSASSILVGAPTSPEPPQGKQLWHHLADAARELLKRPPELRGPFKTDEESLRRVAALPPRVKAKRSPSPSSGDA